MGGLNGGGVFLRQDDHDSDNADHQQANRFMSRHWAISREFGREGTGFGSCERRLLDFTDVGQLSVAL